jgi:long-subunit fatty acid transport protein
MERNLRIILALVCCQLMAGHALAQNDDFGMFYELGAEKKLSSKWSVGAEAEFRTRNNTRTSDRWSAGLSAEYKIVKGLKLSAGYIFLYDNNKEELTFNNDNDPKKWTPCYWGTRHRFHLGLQGSIDWNRFSFSLRERWQYTYRPEKADKKYKFTYDKDDYLSGYTLEPIKGKGKNVSRTRLSIGYDIAHCKVDPFANMEMFVDKNGIQKMRYQAGVDYKIKKQHVFSLTYRYQNVNSDDDDNEGNSHLIGLSYKYKF